MFLGVFMIPTDLAMRPDDLAREVEDRGFESLFVSEHTHIPVSRRTPYPPGRGLPDQYRRMLDPFVALSAASTVTTRLKLGTGICLVAQHDTITLAKQVASLDHLSGGRLVFGIGYGWNIEEMANHGVDPRCRRSLVREKMLGMQRLWSEEEASYEGEFVRFDPSWMWPKPVQQPRPPVLLGGAAGSTLFRHVAEFADGWMPAGGSGLPASLARLRQAFEEADRDPASLRVTVFGSIPDRGKIEHYASLGVERMVLPLPSAGAATALRVLDRYAAFL